MIRVFLSLPLLLLGQVTNRPSEPGMRQARQTQATCLIRSASGRKLGTATVVSRTCPPYPKSVPVTSQWSKSFKGSEFLLGIQEKRYDTTLSSITIRMGNSVRRYNAEALMVLPDPHLFAHPSGPGLRKLAFAAAGTKIGAPVAISIICGGDAPGLALTILVLQGQRMIPLKPNIVEDLLPLAELSRAANRALTKYANLRNR